MESLVTRTASLVGKHVAALCHHLEWDSVAANWVLFRMHKQAVPHPDEWSLGLVDVRLKIPDETLRALADSGAGDMFRLVTEPCLMMTEFQGVNYSLGSAWAFVGGLPYLDGRGNEAYSRVQRIRVMTYLENNKGVVILSREVQPGIAGLLRLVEVDGRHVLTTFSMVEEETQIISKNQTLVDRRPCDICLLTGDACDPRVCNVEQSFSKARAARLSLLEKMDYPVCSLQYIVQWLSGRWTIPVGPFEPMQMHWHAYISGSSFQHALVTVLQNEVEAVHPPRSSFRLFKLAKKEVDYYLDFEDQGAPLDRDSRSGNVEFWATIKASESPKPGRQDGKREHRCETCGTTFKRSYDMKRHNISVHRKVREFKCPHCDRSFTQSGHMHEHVRMRHTGENVQACSTCNKKFGAKSKLLRHVKTVHEKERNFECSVCLKSYKTRSYLREHLRDQHKLGADEVNRLSALKLTD
uniref:C2H2-type domain-containing protein n=1 Tax=Rhodosorus marinus TaxID=101924 RepID=A0A7S2ZCB0_9RHOD|mmetsp:Transcript_14351/g.58060  ORF Transcript_14351/g.58060 Transcript_14351/m.58060 type:complete len:467 (+) Transcript_14351:300-1700(+)